MAPEGLPSTRDQQSEPPGPDLLRVFHRLNNQLGIVLANAELLEAKLTEESQRARAGQVVSCTLEAISTIQDLRRLVGMRIASDR